MNTTEKESKVQLINVASGSFTGWNGDAYASDIYRSAVDILARTAGKLKGAHYISEGGSKHEKPCALNRLLQIEPNRRMSAYDFLYKVTSHYYLYNNSFIYIDRNGQSIEGLYPIDALSAQVYEEEPSGNIWLQFRLKDGKEAWFKEEDVIHLRRHFSSGSFFGDSNEPIQAALSLAHSQNEGMIKSIESSATIRGLIKATQIMDKEKLQKFSESFKQQFLSAQNEGGVIATDQTMEYIPLDQKPVQIDTDQLKAVRDKIYSYLGINEKIVNGSYTEDEWNAFYENVIEPYSIQLSEEFTRKIFTPRERTFGNQVIFSSGRMIFAGIKSKIDLVQTLTMSGILTLNETREIFNLAPVEGEEGNKRIVSLNYTDSTIANKYQLNKAKEQ